MAYDHPWVGTANSVSLEDLPGQIQPSAACILVEIAKYVGQLQGSAERLCNGVRGIARVTENVNREMADGARHPRAVEIECGQVGRANVFARVHLHAVDDGQEIPSAQ